VETSVRRDVPTRKWITSVCSHLFLVQNNIFWSAVFTVFVASFLPKVQDTYHDVTTSCCRREMKQKRWQAKSAAMLLFAPKCTETSFVDTKVSSISAASYSKLYRGSILICFAWQTLFRRRVQIVSGHRVPSSSCSINSTACS
jgi:hypothetical protein